MYFRPLSLSLLASALCLPNVASAQIFNQNPFTSSLGGGNALVGAGLGALAGGALGSNLAASNAQQEGTAIGAVLGGLAGARMSNRSSFNSGLGSVLGGGMPYGSGFNGRNPYVGAGLGAIAGGVLGSNLAASNAQQEGTALGAVLGGVAGYAMSNRNAARSRYGSYGSYGSNGTGYSNGYSNGYSSGGQHYVGQQYGGNTGYQPASTMPAPQSYYSHNVTTQYVQPAPIAHAGPYMNAPQSYAFAPANIGTSFGHAPYANTSYNNVTTYPVNSPVYRPTVRHHVRPALPMFAPIRAPHRRANGYNLIDSGLYCYANSSVKYNSIGQAVCK